MEAIMFMSHLGIERRNITFKSKYRSILKYQNLLLSKIKALKILRIDLFNLATLKPHKKVISRLILLQ